MTLSIEKENFVENVFLKKESTGIFVSMKLSSKKSEIVELQQFEFNSKLVLATLEF